jgi:nucleotide-binding universal stress UspA family protein
VKNRKILVPLDGSSTAEAALPRAAELAKQNGGAKLVLLRAVDPATLPGGDGQVTAINQAAEYLRNVAVRLRNEGVDVAGRSVCYAAAGPAIVEAARTVRPAFIVMVSRNPDRLTPGSVAEFVLDRTQIPIVLVAPRKAPAENLATRALARIA